MHLPFAIASIAGMLIFWKSPIGFTASALLSLPLMIWLITNKRKF